MITDKLGHIVETRRIEYDIFLRNWLVALKGVVFNTTSSASDGGKDVLGSARNIAGNSSIAPMGMLGSGVTPETNADFRIQTPLYTAPDTCSIGFVTLGIGNQITLAITSAHTFALQTSVTEAGLFLPSGSTIIYLTANNLQITHNTFSTVVVNAGNTFTSTYTLTDN